MSGLSNSGRLKPPLPQTNATYSSENLPCPLFAKEGKFMSAAFS